MAKSNRKQTPPGTTCKACGETNTQLQPCTLTGIGDSARQIWLCGKCVSGIIARAPDCQGPDSGAGPIMSEMDLRRETRKQKALDRLGTDSPQCATCPETHWSCLELHHLEGEDFGKTLVILCRNCHRKLTDTQKDDPAKLGDPPSTLERIGHFLLGLADLLVLLAGKLKEFGLYLIEEARQALLEAAKSQP